ncbi:MULTISPECIES: hypothetical protein [Raoultella]|uniref:hypothetical protein n=1 Tax=Raoultella TaxID=160674 RepID=UPI002E1171CB|nr:hypothetical protein Q1L34_16225 [Raoultella ornithinolytica]
MKGNTATFIRMVNEVMEENKNYFNFLTEKKLESIEAIQREVYRTLGLPNPSTPSYTLGELKNSIQEYIKAYISENKEKEKMDSIVLKKISSQLEVEFLQKKLLKKDAQFYCSFSDALIHYGIYRESKIISFLYVDFWKDLLRMLHTLNLVNQNNYSTRCDENIYKTPGYSRLPELVASAKLINEKLKEHIDIIDGDVVFRKNQEDVIIKKIEIKLSKLDLFEALKIVFAIYEDDKKNFKFEKTIPYKYIINILIKNISQSSHKNNDKKKCIYAVELLTSFISLYQLKEDKFAIVGISGETIVRHLKNQVLYSNFYPIYSLKTSTLINYINYIVKQSINEESFFNSFGFRINDLIKFINFLDNHNGDIIRIPTTGLIKSVHKILESFSVEADSINRNYSSIENLIKNSNIFAMNPIIRYRGNYYVIGFRYFKLNFYNSLVDRIRNTIDKDVNSKIGLNVDLFVENLFGSIQSKHGYEIFSGNYTPPKKENPESDLIIKTNNEIIFIENKNKYLNHASFSGSESEILKDFALSFAFSQTQLLKHERNIRNYKKITFKTDKRKLEFTGQKIIKISISTNNWYNIMNNPSSIVLQSLRNLRFNVPKDDKSDFSKANKYLSELNSVIDDISIDTNVDMATVLTQTVFLPLELLVDKYQDEDFLITLKKLVVVKMNTDNILNVYDYCKYLNSASTRAPA